MTSTDAHDIFDLSDKTVLISGGTGFLGVQFAKTLAHFNAKVFAVDLLRPSETDAESTWGPLLGTHILYEYCDITDPDSTVTLVERIVSSNRRVDVLVNCAAIDPKFEQGDRDSLSKQHFTSFSLSDWQQSIDVNMTGAFLLTQATCRLFERQQAGNIINICSTYGLLGPDQRIYNEGDERTFVKPITYAVTKSAVLGFTRYLAAYYRDQNIRVNALTPGGVERNHDQGFVDRYSARTILGRMASPKDLSGALVFLASDASSYMTGSNLIVDGGWTAF